MRGPSSGDASASASMLIAAICTFADASLNPAAVIVCGRHARRLSGSIRSWQPWVELEQQAVERLQT